MSSDAKTFVDSLVERTQQELASLDLQLAPFELNRDISLMLRVALRNELEAAELAAGWMLNTADLDEKVLLARHTGDEAEHFDLLRKRLGALGVPAPERTPVGGMPTPMLTYLRSLERTPERIAAGFVTRETVAIHKNEQFAQLCDSLGDSETARLYRDRINPDELVHRDYGRVLLERVLPADDAGRARVETARARTVEIAGALTLTAARDKGLCGAPGC